MANGIGTDSIVAQGLAQVAAFQQQRQFAQAESILQSLLAQFPGRPEVLHYLGVLWHRQGRSDEGLELIRKVLAQCPTYSAAYNNLGNILRSKGREEEAAHAYRRAIEFSPRDVAPYNNLGNIYLSAQRYMEAAAVLQVALSLDGNHAESHFNMGCVFEQIGRHEEAIVEFQRAVQLAPGRTDSYYVSLGKLLVLAGRTTEAAEVYRRLLEFVPEHPTGRYMLAACTGQGIPSRASDAYVQEHFEGFAASFDGVLTAIGYRGAAMVAGALAREIPAVEKRYNVLDAGCGTGLCAPYLRPYAQRLVGVDLSNTMLAKAKAKGIYDDLVQEELTSFLRRQSSAWDIIASADVLIYIGDVREVFAAAAAALRPGGRLVVTVEEPGGPCGEAGYRLAANGRYCHSEGYLRKMMEQAGLVVGTVARDVLRKECDKAVPGLVMAGRKV